MGKASKKTRTLSAREKQRRLKQSQDQWEKDNPVEAYGVKRLVRTPRAPIGRGLY